MARLIGALGINIMKPQLIIILNIFYWELSLLTAAIPYG